MLLLLDVDENVIIEVLGGGEILQYMYPVRNEALRVEIVWKVDEFHLIPDVLEKLVIVKRGIVCGVEVTFGYAQGVLGLFCQHLQRQAGVAYAAVCAEYVLHSCDYPLAVVAGYVHIMSYCVGFGKIQLYVVSAEKIGIEP